jgi:hypothetical protein
MSLRPSHTYTPPSTAKPTGYDDLDLIGYLYNACYGGFSFSEEFVRRMNEKRVAAGMETETDTWKFTEYSNERVDPMVIELYQELGSEASSGYYSQIHITWIPREFLKYVDVHDYDGTESVRVDFKDLDSDLLKNFLEEWKANPTLTVEDLNQRYTVAKEKVARYKEYQKERWNKNLDD